MEDPVRSDILKLFRSNPLLRDTAEVIATRLGRGAAHVEQVLQELEKEGLIAARWVGGSPLYSFTGAPDPVSSPETGTKTVEIPTVSSPAVETLHWSDTAFLKPEEIGTIAAHFFIPSTLEGVTLARDALSALCRISGMAPQILMEFTIAISEALTNAYRYGRRGDGRDSIRIDFKVAEDQAAICVQDRGSGFPSLLVGSAIGDVYSTGGRGLMLMRNFTDSMDIARSGTGTIVTLVRKLKPPTAPGTAEKPDGRDA